MVAGCRCLKENVDALRIESVRYGRVTGNPHLTACLLRPESPCRGGPLDLAIETARQSSMVANIDFPICT
jgi:hypothetical protein